MDAASEKNIYQYLDVIQFLTDHFQKRKAKDESFSLRTWAKELGFQSPESLINILKKKAPIKLKLVTLFAKSLALDSAELNYFKAIVLYSNLKNEEERTVFLSLLEGYRPSKTETTLRVDDPSIFSSWLDGAIMEIGKLQNVRLTEEEIEKRLRKKVSRERIQERVQKLSQAGLLRKTDEGSFETLRQPISTKTDQPNPRIQDYYSEVSHLALESTGLPLEEREFQCFAMAIRKTDLPVMKTHLRDFRKRMESFGGEAQADSVYQINLQCFPITVEGSGSILTDE